MALRDYDRSKTPFTAIEPGTPQASSGRAGDDPHLWQEAQERVLLYLKKLGMPALLSLELAHKALGKAADEGPAAGSVRPTVLAMAALHEILVEDPEILHNTPHAKYAILYRRWHPENPQALDSCKPDSGTGMLLTAPPVNRCSMNIRKI